MRLAQIEMIYNMGNYNVNTPTCEENPFKLGYFTRVCLTFQCNFKMTPADEIQYRSAIPFLQMNVKDRKEVYIETSLHGEP